ncbi:MAG: hypothetical protein ACJ79W_15895 [Myxococcales bacterium]
MIKTVAAEWRPLSLITAFLVVAATFVGTLVAPPLSEAVLAAVAEEQGNVVYGVRPVHVAQNVARE